MYFRFSNGQFIADADIADRLEKLTDASGATTAWRYTVAATEEIETYDSAGRLTLITSRSGLTQALTYGSNTKLSTVVDSYGRTLTFGYDADNRIRTVTDPSGQVYTYTYNDFGNVTSVTYPDSASRTYLYNESAHTGGPSYNFALTGIVDESNSRFETYKWGQYQRVTSTEQAGGVEKYQFSYAGDDRSVASTTVTDPLGTPRVYNFTVLHGMAKNTSMSQPCTSGCGGGSAAATTYDGNGNVASKTDFKGNKICYAHDLARNLELIRLEGVAPGVSCPADLTTYTPPANTRQRKISTQWHPTHRLPTQIDEAGKRTTFTHDPIGNVLTRTVTDLSTAPNVSRTWTYTYNAVGQVLTVDGPRTDVSDITTYTYYSCNTGSHCGQVHTITNAAGHVTTYNTYNAHGQPLTITDANGVLTTLTYDLRQRLKTRTVGAEVTTFDYWPTGLLKKAALPDGSYLDYIYDAAHRLTDINDSDGNRIHYTLDPMGNRLKEDFYDPSNAPTLTNPSRIRNRVFDALNRLQKEIGAANTAAVTTTYGYDNNGNQTTIAAPLVPRLDPGLR